MNPDTPGQSLDLRPAFRRLGAHLHQLYAVYHIGERERLLVDHIVRCSLDIGEADAHIQHLSEFTAWTGIDPSTARKVLLDLARKRVILANTTAGIYTPLPDPNQWAVPMRKIRPAVQQLAFSQLLADPDSLGRAIAAVQRELALARLQPQLQLGSDSASSRTAPLAAVGEPPTPPVGDFSPTPPPAPAVVPHSPPGSNRNNFLPVTPGNRVVGETPTASDRREEEYWLREIGRLCGAGELAHNGGAWRNRLRENRAAVVKAVEALKLNRAGVDTTPAKYLNRVWRNQARRNQPNDREDRTDVEAPTTKEIGP